MPRVHVGPEDRVIRLRDGRLMGFAEYGDPGGFTVVNAHGGLAGRLDVAAADRSARDAGIRLLSPDRPGIGLSDPQPGRTVLDWARDVEDLANHLGVGRFGVMGWSMGGQYALAVGSRVASRVTSVAVIAGALPLTESGVFAQLPAGDRAFTRLSQHAPLVARICFRVMGAVALRAPRLFRRLGARDLGAADAAVLRSEPVRNFSLMSGEALRTAPGMVEDYRAWMRPWGFAPEDLTVPVDVWGGSDDELVPTHWPPALARRIPGATLNIRTGGHFMAHLHYREILGTLRQRSEG
ncbi:alpha/beta hydrolase [Rhodococcus jostii]|uniref:Alpha/beta hydrolase n=1 Tax=Rhodococcus jostii TaxID=132919 RepID=A0ABU4CPW4_RHOJO|nr:alpha/beta hydrolase [Rhodococcus jostii]MDV6285569.1 alpha/beta hydrolase [Rhodococcus jostii]